MEFMQKAMAKSKPRRLMSPQSAYKGIEACLGDCVLFHCQACKRSASGWCGPAEAKEVELHAATISY